MSEITSSFSSLAAFAAFFDRFLGSSGQLLGSLGLELFRRHRGFYLYFCESAFVLTLHMQEILALGFS